MDPVGQKDQRLMRIAIDHNQGARVACVENVWMTIIMTQDPAKRTILHVSRRLVNEELVNPVCRQKVGIFDIAQQPL